MNKTNYTPPVLRAHGQVEAATQGGTVGNLTDQVIVVGTPVTNFGTEFS